MSAFEQKREIPNRALQYMVVRLSFFNFLSFYLFLALEHAQSSQFPFFP
jgi:hypothetical protein